MSLSKKVAFSHSNKQSHTQKDQILKAQIKGNAL